MTAISVSRRQALVGTTAAISSGAFSGLRARTAHAKAPRATEQAPCYYRFNHGKFKRQLSPTGLCGSVMPPQAFLEHRKKKSRRC